MNDYQLHMNGKLVAACPTLAAHDAARRLLGQKS